MISWSLIGVCACSVGALNGFGVYVYWLAKTYMWATNKEV